MGAAGLRAWTSFVPTDDGTELATDVQLPDPSYFGPALLLRTPYGRREVAATGMGMGLRSLALTDAGYALVTQDVRGRGDSSGNFRFLAQERSDGIDTLRWLAAQPWCDGRIFGVGSSYSGRAQLLLGADHGLLHGCMPAMAGLSSTETWWPGGVLELGLASFWIRDLASSSVRDLDEPSRKTVLGVLDRNDPVELARAALDPEHPIRRLLGAIVPYLDREAEPEESIADAPATPSLHMTGWYDTMAEATISAWASCDTDDAHQLVVGPWSHSDLGAFAGGVTALSGSAADLGLEARYLRFLDAHLRGGRGIDARATVYVTGANRWEEFVSWPPPTEPASLFFDGTLGGLTTHLPERGEISLYASASDPVPSIGDPAAFATNGDRWPRSVRSWGQLLAGRADVTLLSSEAIDDPIEIVGRAIADLWISADVPGGGVVVKLLELGRSGDEQVIARGVGLLHANRRTLTIPFSPAHHRVGSGSRLGVLIATSEHERYLVGVDADRWIRIRTGPRYPSSILLPVSRQSRHV